MARSRKDAPPANELLRKPMSFQLDMPTYDRLRKLAFDKHQPMTELMIRGIEMVLKAERY